MADKFKFKYLDPDYIKRVQVNVNKNAYQCLEKDAAQCSVENLKQCRSDERRNLLKNIEQNDSNECDITKFKTKVSLRTPKPVISKRHTLTVPKLKLKPIRSSAPVNYINTGVLTKVPLVVTPSTGMQSHRAFDDIETILAKITSIQQTICCVIDSLIPNLMQKPSFDTPAEADKCRKRFDGFLRMFTRNYLYPIELMVTETQSNKYFSPNGIASKILSLHNILQVAVTSYVSNVRSFLDRDVPPKIEHLLGFVQLTMIACVNRMLFDEGDCVIQSVLDKVNDTLIQLESMRSTKRVQPESKTKFTAIKGAKKQTNRLCMYNFPKKTSKAVQKIVHQHQIPSSVGSKGVKLTQTVSRSDGNSGAFNRGDQQSQRQTDTRSYDIMLQKHMTQRPAFGSKDKIMDEKCEFNDNTEFGVNQPTVSRRSRSSHRTVVDSTNRTASGLMVEKELFKSKNMKYSQVISTRDVDDPEHQHFEIEMGKQNDIDSRNRVQKLNVQEKSKKSQLKGKKVNVPSSQKSLCSKKLLSRISEELNVAPIEQFHKNLDFGERMFIEKFIALEISI